MGNAVVYDHDEIEVAASRIRENAADVSTIKASLDDMLNAMVTEASINTGSPAPVFGPILTSTQRVVERLKGALDIIAERLEEGASIIEDASRGAKGIAEEGASGVDKVASDAENTAAKPGSGFGSGTGGTRSEGAGGSGSAS